MKPENVGDIYLVRGYPWSGAAMYGRAYRYVAPGATTWVWALEMDDGDNFTWLADADRPDMPCDSVELVRRNALPFTAPPGLAAPDDFKRDFRALCLDERPVVMELSKFQAWVIFSHLQLALRHPTNQGETSKHARAIAQHLERLLARTPALRRVAEMGWKEEYDQ